MIKVGVAGATGYVGIELIRILLEHPDVQVCYVATQSHVGSLLSTVYPHLRGRTDLVCAELNGEAMAEECDLIFAALPHGHALPLAISALEANKKFIDLGADFRLKDPVSYERWYQHPPAPLSLLQEAVYGLPELTPFDQIKQARLVANPGCYPTSIALGAYPALSSGIVNPTRVIFDAKSGVSGAGRGLHTGSLFSEIGENFRAYGVGGTHRHTPEIEQILAQVAGTPLTVQFTPHLIPMVRGLLTTAYLPLCTLIPLEEVWKIYADTYQNKPFVRLCPIGEVPQTANVRGSNHCDIGLQVDPRTNTLIVVSVIDNLIKGAAGQAVQNMNLMFNLPETTGLKSLCPSYP